MTSPASLLEQLVRIDSTNDSPLCDAASSQTGAELEIGRFVSDWLMERGFDIEWQEAAPTRSSVIGRNQPFRTDVPALAFEAHLDTIGAEGMTIAPFEAKRERGRIYGRGAVDTKGSLAAMLVALEELSSKDLPLDLMFIGACAEETGCEGISRLEMERWPDAAIVGEPTSNQPVATHKGFIWFDLTIAGRAGHSSDPESADNAVMRASRVIEFLRKWAERNLTVLRNRDYDCSTLAVNRIVGGTKVNVSPAACTLSVDIRLVPGASASQILDELRRSLGKEFSFPVEFSRTRIAPGLRRRAESGVTDALRLAVGQVTGKDEPAGAVHYGTDAGILQQREVDCVVFGPGEIARAHGEKESVAVAEVEQAAQILTQCALRYADCAPV
jgi:acetylornithine deacetylase/succinyl-diaminopimelate desuccinylase-like protein